MPEQLALSVTHADGRVTRWGPDEPNGQDIPNDLTFGDSIPGGHRDLSTSLLRRIDIQHADEALFDDVHCYGAGGRTAWRGRMAQFPRTHGDSYGVTPGAVGWSAHLRDDPSFSMIYIDRDLGRWGPMTAARQVAVIGQQGFGVQGSGSARQAATFTQDFVGAWATGHKPLVEAWYDAGPGNVLGRLRGTFDGGPNLNTADATWAITAYLAEGLGPTATDSSGDLWPGTAGTGSADVAATAATRRYAILQFLYDSAPAGTDGVTWNVDWTNLRVFGNHGLSIVGTTAADEGIYASDAIADIVTRAAPLLSVLYTYNGGQLESTTFPIPQLAFPTPTTAEDAISAVNAYHLYDWGVYDNREFFFRRPDPDRLLWEARLSDGAKLDADGDTAEQVINGVFVTYTDAAGTTHTVGPPGGAFDNTDSALADTSSSNPVNAHGIPRKWTQLALSVPTTLAGATAIGAAYLAERSLAGRRGTVTLTGTATHPTEGKVPCWRVRAGDWISLKDLTGATVPRKIIDKTYSHGNRQVTLQLDNTVAKLDAILARVGVHAGITLGGGF